MLQFFFVLGSDFSKFFNHNPMVFGDTVKLSHSLRSTINPAMSKIVAGALREENNTNSKYKNPEERDPHWNAAQEAVLVRASVPKLIQFATNIPRVINSW